MVSTLQAATKLLKLRNKYLLMVTFGNGKSYLIRIEISNNGPLFELIRFKTKKHYSHSTDSFYLLTYTQSHTHMPFLARGSIYMCWAHYMLSAVRPSVCPSVTRVAHTKTVQLRVMQFSTYSSPSSAFYRISFVQKFWGFSPSVNKGGLGETCYFHSSNAFARWLHKLEVTVCFYRCCGVQIQHYSPGDGTVVRQLGFLLMSVARLKLVLILCWF